jgi:hypothetical protein
MPDFNPDFAALHPGYAGLFFVVRMEGGAIRGRELRLTNLFSRIKFLSIPLHTEGRFAIVTMRGAGCGGRARCSIAGPARNFRPRTDRAAKAMTTTPRADGPSRRSWRDASRQAAAGKAGSFFRGDGRRRKSAISVGNNGSPTGGCPKQAVKTTACGTPDASGAAVVTTLVCSPTHTHTRLRTHRASGVPRALPRRAKEPNTTGAPAPA